MIMKHGDVKHNVNCIVVGDGMVGKSTLALSFTQQKFPDDYVATVFENYAGKLMLNCDIFIYILPHLC